MNSGWRPDRNSKETIQSQIISHIKQLISSGAIPAGGRLESERKLAEAFGVNRSTISFVVSELKAQGVVVSHGRRGTFAASNPWELMGTARRQRWDEYISYGIHKPNQRIIQKINRYEFEDGIIRLGTGELSPELFPRDMVKEMMIRIASSIHSMNYEPDQGNCELRAELSTYLKKYGIDASEQEILVVSGSLQALHLIATGLLQPGSAVYVEKPSYLKSLYVFQSAGISLHGIGMKDGGIDLDCLGRRMKRSGTNLLYTIPTYQNPTGALMPQEKRVELIEFARERNIPVIEDDAYRELWIDEMPPNPIKSMDNAGNVLYMGTLSKSFSPGIRVGWLVGPRPVMERLADIKMQMDYGSSSISQGMALEWIRGGYCEAYGERLREVLRRKRDMALGLLEIHFSGIATWSRPAGGFYIWVRLAGKIHSNRLFNKALEKRILINPGSIYDFEENSAIRLSYAYASEDQMEYAIQELAAMVRECLAD